jgi:hypothetical protein
LHEHAIAHRRSGRQKTYGKFRADDLATQRLQAWQKRGDQQEERAQRDERNGKVRPVPVDTRAENEGSYAC